MKGRMGQALEKDLEEVRLSKAAAQVKERRIAPIQLRLSLTLLCVVQAFSSLLGRRLDNQGLGAALAREFDELGQQFVDSLTLLFEILQGSLDVSLNLENAFSDQRHFPLAVMTQRTYDEPRLGISHVEIDGLIKCAVRFDCERIFAIKAATAVRVHRLVPNDDNILCFV
jgi:hypothetical protein